MIVHFIDNSVNEIDCIVMAYKLKLRKSVYDLTEEMTIV